MGFSYTLFIFLIAYLCAYITQAASIGAEQFYFQLRSVRVTNDIITAISHGSLIECATRCSLNADCWIAMWHEDDEVCEMYDYQLTISLEYPVNAGSSTEVVLFGKPISGKT